MTPSNVTSSYKVCGIFPLNLNVVISKLPHSSFKPQSLLEKSGLAYVPLYSPCEQKRSKSFWGLAESDDDCDVSTGNFSFEKSFSESDLQSPSLFAPPISKFLVLPKLPPGKQNPSHGKVLTSVENLKAIERNDENGKRKRKSKKKTDKRSKERVKLKLKVKAN